MTRDEIIQAFLTGEPQAPLQHLQHQGHQWAARQLNGRRVNPEADADDYVQEATITFRRKLCEGPATQQGIRDPKAYFFRIVQRLVWHDLKHQPEQVSLAEAPEGRTTAEVPRQAQTTARLYELDLRLDEAVRQALALMPPEWRTAHRLKYCEHKSWTAVAAYLQVEPAPLRKRAHVYRKRQYAISQARLLAMYRQDAALAGWWQRHPLPTEERLGAWLRLVLGDEVPDFDQAASHVLGPAASDKGRGTLVNRGIAWVEAQCRYLFDYLTGDGLM